MINEAPLGNEETQLTKLLNQSDVRPRSEPALELHCRAMSSVGVMYCSSGPNTGNNPGGGRIIKKGLPGPKAIFSRVYLWPRMQAKYKATVRIYGWDFLAPSTNTSHPLLQILDKQPLRISPITIPQIHTMHSQASPNPTQQK